MQLAEIIAFINPEETILGTPEYQITELAIDSRKVTDAEHTPSSPSRRRRTTDISMSPNCISSVSAIL